MTKKATVLNTRPSDQAAELSRLLRLADFDVAEAPAIRIVPAWEADELAVVRQGLLDGAFAWVILPSLNAAVGLEATLRAARVVCGVATASALGINAEIALTRFSAAAAVEALRPLLRPGQRVLVPHAAEGRDELIDGLRDIGVEVAAPIAYRTVESQAAADALRLGGIDVVTMCSPSAVRSVAGAVPRMPLVVCLGSTTAQAARQAGLRVDGVAASTTMASLVAAVEAAVGARV